MYSDLSHLHHMYMAQKRVTPRFKRRLRRTFLRQWREKREMTLEQLAERVGVRLGAGFTHASLSRIERGLQPYSQPILEAVADELQIDVASLLMRDPSDPEAMWSIWDQAKQGERKIIVDIAKTIVKTGT
jgi:transcriptional regulator with XRE-family HTH domain